MSETDKREHRTADWIGTGPGPALAHDHDLGLWLTSSGSRAPLSPLRRSDLVDAEPQPGAEAGATALGD